MAASYRARPGGVKSSGPGDRYPPRASDGCRPRRAAGPARTRPIGSYAARDFDRRARAGVEQSLPGGLGAAAALGGLPPGIFLVFLATGFSAWVLLIEINH
jgi:hypothetical protein